MEISEKAKSAIEYSLEQNKLNDKQKMLLICNLVGKKLNDVADRESAIIEANRVLTGRYNFNDADEVIRRINELFLVYFPVNVYLQETILNSELSGKENVR